MGKYIIAPAKLPTVERKKFSFSLRSHYGNSATIVLSPDGIYSLDVNGWEDDYVIENRAKRDSQYKTGIQKVSNELFLDYQARTEFVSLMSKRAFKPIGRTFLQKERDKIQIEEYQPNAFVVNKPQSDEVVAMLQTEGNSRYYKDENNSTEVRRFVTENKEKVYKERVANWNEILKLFNDIEKANKEKADFSFRQAYNAKRTVYDDIINGQPSVIENGFDDAINKLAVPYEISLDFDYNQQLQTIDIDVEIPDSIEPFVPTEKATILSSGKVSIKSKQQKEIRNEIVNSQLSLLYYIASYAFSLTPHIEHCRMSLWSKHKTYGYCWIDFSRNKFKSHAAPEDYLVTWKNVNNIGEFRGANVLNHIDKKLFKKLIQERSL